LALSLAAVRAYRIALDELHNDSTSLCLYGAYRGATGAPRGGVSPPRPARGLSKDHRPDLKQLVWILTVSADGAVPVTYRLCDGNTEDSTTHIQTWESCRALAGRADFLYVADCKLATRDNMDHLACHGGRFLSILPRTRTEDAAGRAWLARGPIPFVEVARRPGRRKADPDEVYWAVPAPTCSEEGYRVVWVRSSSKRAHDSAVRADHIETATAALAELAASLGHRLRLLAAMQRAGAALMSGPQLGRDVFARGMPEGLPRVDRPVYELTLYELLSAYGEGHRRSHARVLTIELPTFHSLDEALHHLARFVGHVPEWRDLLAFLPEELRGALYRRSALAATFAATLELTRAGRVELRQDRAFGPIYLRSTAARRGDAG
jgi:hypothetical protein